MSESPVIRSTHAFGSHDRRAGLIVFGVLSILVGCVCALIVPLMFLGQALSARATGQPANYRMIVPLVTVYGALAVGFVWLGAGSILARRWARALLLVVAWMWLLLGVFTTGLMAFMLPHVLDASQMNGEQLAGGARLAVTIVSLALAAFVTMILPAAFILFYRSRHVRATCERLDPVPRWTDVCPLSVLALSLGLAFAPLSLVGMLIAYDSVFPFFGWLVTGAPATALLVLSAAACTYGAWATYRLKPAGWWVVTVMFGVLAVSSLLTFSRVDLLEVYRAMGYSREQISSLDDLPFVRGRALVGTSALLFIPLMWYLLSMKRHFREGPSPEPPRPEPDTPLSREP